MAVEGEKSHGIVLLPPTAADATQTCPGGPEEVPLGQCCGLHECPPRTMCSRLGTQGGAREAVGPLGVKV